MINFDYLLAAWWLAAIVLFVLPIAIIERRQNVKHNKRLYGI